MPCALLFDTFGTIVDWRASLIDELTAFGLKRGIRADWAELVDAWRGAYVPSMDEVGGGNAPGRNWMTCIARLWIGSWRSSVSSDYPKPNSVISIELGIACVPGRISCPD